MYLYLKMPVCRVYEDVYPQRKRRALPDLSLNNKQILRLGLDISHVDRYVYGQKDIASTSRVHAILLVPTLRIETVSCSPSAHEMCLRNNLRIIHGARL